MKIEIDKGKWVAIFFTFFSDCAAVFIGIMARYFFTEAGYDVEETLENNGQNSLILVIEFLLPIVFVGLYIAVILAAIMSTVDSLLVLASSALVLDIYYKILKPSLSLKKACGYIPCSYFYFSIYFFIDFFIGCYFNSRTNYFLVCIGRLSWYSSKLLPDDYPCLILERFFRRGELLPQ